MYFISKLREKYYQENRTSCEWIVKKTDVLVKHDIVFVWYKKSKDRSFYIILMKTISFLCIWNQI